MKLRNPAFLLSPLKSSEEVSFSFDDLQSEPVAFSSMIICHKIHFLYKCFHLFNEKNITSNTVRLTDFFNSVNYTIDIINNFNTKTMAVRWAQHPINGNK